MKLHLYFARRYFLIFLGVFVILAAFQGLFDLIEEIRRVSDNGGLGLALQLTALKLPEGIYEILPLVMILSSVALFLGLARSSELVVARAVGRSGFAVLLSPAVVAFAVGIAVVGILNPIVAATSKRYIDQVDRLETGSTSAISIGSEGLWLRQGSESGQSVIRAARANADATTLFDVSFVLYGPDGGPAHRVLATEAQLRDGAWHLRDAKAWPLSAGLNPEVGARIHPTYELPSNLTRESIRDRFGKPNAVPFWDLPAFIQDLDTAGFSSRRHLVWFQMELARPLFLAALMMVGAAFTMRPTRLGNTGLGVLSAVLLGFGLFYIRNFAQILGESGQLSPILAAWVPPVASFLLATGLILHMEDG
ncbi:MAG: LPS export ABC transporter permease LptG [Pelagimonas sp.]|jgi:lipopolysaccharide export system permease protein|nr:LPS export ABC transporter permease LptG [Pelagimonas sp.]